VDETGKQKVLDRIRATGSADDLAGCDLIIEAVFEDSDLKAKVTQEAEPHLAENGIFASNTSTIPITRSLRSRRPTRRNSSACTSFPRGQNAAGRDHQGREDR